MISAFRKEANLLSRWWSTESSGFTADASYIPCWSLLSKRLMLVVAFVVPCQNKSCFVFSRFFLLNVDAILTNLREPPWTTGCSVVSVASTAGTAYGSFSKETSLYLDCLVQACLRINKKFDPHPSLYLRLHRRTVDRARSCTP